MSTRPFCPCGCALAAWSMPWPVRTEPWTPATVHGPRPHGGHVAESAFFPLGAVDPELVDGTGAACAGDPGPRPHRPGHRPPAADLGRAS